MNRDPYNRLAARPLVLCLLAFVACSAAGCVYGGLDIQQPPLAALSKVPVSVLVDPAQVERRDFILDGETNTYNLSSRVQPIAWLDQDTVDDLARDYVAEAEIFDSVLDARSAAANSGLYLVARPHFTFTQYVRSSVRGAVLTLGTGLLYNILGGSADYRYIECELVMELTSPQGRPVAAYTATCRSAERLVTERADQLGPLASFTFTRTLDNVAAQISADNDLLMRALTADMNARGAVPIAHSAARIVVSSPRGIIVRSRAAQISGQIVGIDRPVTLQWSLADGPATVVPTIDTNAPSVRRFSFDIPLQNDVNRVVLSLRERAEAPRVGAELARTEVAYLSMPQDAPLPKVRQRWALVVGISQYAHADAKLLNLKYADRDAQALYDFLVSPRSGGFDRDKVMLLLNKDATAENIRHGLFEFLARAGRDDLVVIFFSGHGMPQPGTENFYLLANDTRSDRLASTAFPMWDIDTALRRMIHADRVVVFADVCHAGAATLPAGAKAGDGNAVNQYLQQLALAEPGRLIFTAGEQRELSYEGPQWGGGHGAFTWYLLDGLRGKADADSDSVVTAGELVEYVRAGVIDATHQQQHPYPSGQYDRDLPLAVVLGQ